MPKIRFDNRMYVLKPTADIDNARKTNESIRTVSAKPSGRMDLALRSIVSDHMGTVR
jgi:hypothetical protein